MLPALQDTKKRVDTMWWIDSWTILDAELLRALGWTLVHTLWQGAVAALAVALACRALPQRDPQRRYLVAVGALLAIPVAAGITFWLHCRVSMGEGMLAEGGDPAWQVVEGALGQVSGGEGSGWKEWIERQLPHVAVGWLVGCCFFLLRLAGGVSYLWWLRWDALPLDAEWQLRVDRLVREAGLRKVVRVARSRRVRVPVAFGLLKPIVLLPAALVVQLPPAAVEAVIWHELMHIRRRDFAVRLLQGLVEAVFYYHPAVWWISAVIGREREYACDDAVVRRLGDRLSYARALMMSGELAGGRPALAMGLVRRRSGLLARVQRLLDPSKQNRSLMERTVAIVLLIAALSVSARWAQSGRALPLMPGEAASSAWHMAESVRDTLPHGQQEGKKEVARLIKVEDGRTVEVEMEGETITKVIVDGRPVPPDSFGQYRGEVEAMRRQMARPDLFELDSASLFPDEDVFEQAEILLEEDFEPDTLIAFDMDLEVDTTLFDEEGWHGPRGRMEWHMEQLERRLDQMEKELDRFFEYQDEAFRRRLEEAMQQAERAMERLHEELPDDLLERGGARQGRADFPEQGPWMERLERALLRDGLIEAEQPWTLELSNRKMKVNGKSVSPQIHRKYVELYERFHGTAAKKWKVRYAVPGKRTSERRSSDAGFSYWWNWWY